VLAFFISLIASMNYINLSTARAIRRSREVCVRKVVGAHRSEIIKQFLGESTIMTFSSLLVAVVLVSLFINRFAAFVDRDIKMQSITTPGFILVLMGTGLLLGILSGLYPAVFLSRFSPIKIIKGASGRRGKGFDLRNVLVVFQFSISVFLIFSTLIISGQMDYIRNKKLGYEKKHVVVVDLPFNTGRRMQDTARDELLQIHGIKGVTFSLTEDRVMTSSKHIIVM
jgi:putative ABC transport system permease protein